MARNANNAKVNEVAKAAPARKNAPKAANGENVEIAAFNDATFSKETALVFNFDKYDTVSKIDEGIERLQTMGSATATLAHELVVASIRHYVTSGDYTKLAALFDAIKQSMGNSRVSALIKYVRRYVPTIRIEYIDETKKSLGLRLIHQKGMKRRFIAEEKGIIDSVFWKDMEPEIPVIAFNFKTELAKLLDRARKVGDRVSHAVNGQLLDKEGKPTAKVGDVDVPTNAEILALADSFNLKLQPAE